MEPFASPRVRSRAPYSTAVALLLALLSLSAVSCAQTPSVPVTEVLSSAPTAQLEVCDVAPYGPSIVAHDREDATISVYAPDGERRFGVEYGGGAG